MFTFTVCESVVIDRPIEGVFNFIADSRNDRQWCQAVKEIEQITGEGPGEGARYRMHHTPGGMAFDATVEMLTYDPPHRLEWRMTDSGHTIHGTYRLEAAGKRTRLTQTSQIAFEGWMRIPGLVMKRFIRKDVEKEIRQQFANLKQLLERESVRERQVV